jgi:hypothetical protein
MRLLFALLVCAGCGGTENPAPSDMAGMQMTNNDALKPFGAACTHDGDCATGHCFIGGAMSFCTMPCTAPNMTNDPLCPNPPTSGTCNMKGYCKP